MIPLTIQQFIRRNLVVFQKFASTNVVSISASKNDSIICVENQGLGRFYSSDIFMLKRPQGELNLRSTRRKT